jgi:hypothetical protein
MSEPQHPPISIDPAFWQQAADVQNRATEADQVQIAIPAAETAQPPTAHGTLPFPPGFVYQQAPLPVPEVAVVAALGLMAGICGKAWHIPGSGLNLYIVLVARSAIGKEAMHSGISKIVGAATQSFPQFGNFVDFSDYASGPALIKACAQNSCFVNVAGEIGHKFLEMADAKAASPMRNYRKQLTSLYSKSGPDGISGGISYSSQENNIEAVQAVAFSLIGETTPGTFYESITDAMLADGFMSRFCVIEYTGDRPDMNDAPLQRPDQRLLDNIVAIARKADTLIGAGHFQEVSFSDTARSVLNLFRLECHNAIIAAGDDERLRAVWNRAHLNALRVSALLAVGDNYIFPVVTDEHAAWAIALMRHGTSAFLNRLRAGEVGEGSDGGREQKVLDLCREFLLLPADKMPVWLKDGERMRQSSIVPRKYLQQRTQRLAAFEKFHRGHKAALDMAIQTAFANGNLMEVKKDKLVEQFGFHGQAYRLLCAT